jgi:hypothetical protein
MKTSLVPILAVCLAAWLPQRSLAACPEGSIQVGEPTVRVESGKRITERQCLATRYAGSWEPALQRDLERALRGIPDEWFRRWASSSVVFTRGMRGMLDSPLAAAPGVINIYDPFAALDTVARRDLLAFELGKVLWFARINPGPREAQTQRRREFEALYRRHARTIEAMRFGGLVDDDVESKFAYACRVLVLNLQPAQQPPPGYSAEQWADVRGDWERTRSEMRGYVGALYAPDR